VTVCVAYVLLQSVLPVTTATQASSATFALREASALVARMPLSPHVASTSSPPPVPRMLESVSALLVSELGAEVVEAVLREGCWQTV
jgi:hypothetical protein